MVRNPTHEMLSPPNHDERSLQQYVLSLKHHVGREIQPHKRDIYERRAKPAFEKTHGRAPETWREIGGVMLTDPDYQMSIALNTMAQDLMWESVADPIYRNIDKLGDTYAKLSESPDTVRSAPMLTIGAKAMSLPVRFMKVGATSIPWA
jgi:hypothetical protein